MDSQNQKTAKIYAFPVQKMSISKTRLANLEAEARQYVAPEFGSGWYHDAAIDKHPQKRHR